MTHFVGGAVVLFLRARRSPEKGEERKAAEEGRVSRERQEESRRQKSKRDGKIFTPRGIYKS